MRQDMITEFLKVYGDQILEIPASNQTFEKIDEYKAIAKRYEVEIRFREE